MTPAEDKVHFARAASAQRTGPHEGDSQIGVAVTVHVTRACDREAQIAPPHAPVNPDQSIPARIKGADVQNPLSLGVKQRKGKERAREMKPIQS